MKLSRKFGIYSTTSTFFSLVAIALIGIPTLVTYAAERRRTVSSLVDRIEGVAKSSGATIEAWLTERRRTVEIAAKVFENTVIVSALTEEPENLNPFLTWQSGETEGTINAFFFATEDGRLYRGFDWEPPVGWDPREKPWYNLAKEGGREPVTSSYRDSLTGTRVISIAVPLIDGENRVLGVLGSATTLAEVLERSTAPKGLLISAGIFDAQGTVLATPSYNSPRATLPNEATLAALWPALGRQKTGSAFYSLNGTKRLIAYEPVASTGWAIAIIAEPELFTEPLGRLAHRYGLFAIAALIAIFVVSRLMSDLFAFRIHGVARNLELMAAEVIAEAVGESDRGEYFAGVRRAPDGGGVSHDEIHPLREYKKRLREDPNYFGFVEF